MVAGIIYHGYNQICLFYWPTKNVNAAFPLSPHRHQIAPHEPETCAITYYQKTMSLYSDVVKIPPPAQPPLLWLTRFCVKHNMQPILDTEDVVICTPTETQTTMLSAITKTNGAAHFRHTDVNSFEDLRMSGRRERNDHRRRHRRCVLDMLSQDPFDSDNVDSDDDIYDFDSDSDSNGEFEYTDYDDSDEGDDVYTDDEYADDLNDDSTELGQLYLIVPKTAEHEVHWISDKLLFMGKISDIKGIFQRFPEFKDIILQQTVLVSEQRVQLHRVETQLQSACLGVSSEALPEWYISYDGNTLQTPEELLRTVGEPDRVVIAQVLVNKFSETYVFLGKYTSTLIQLFIDTASLPQKPWSLMSVRYALEYYLRDDLTETIRNYIYHAATADRLQTPDARGWVTFVANNPQIRVIRPSSICTYLEQTNFSFIYVNSWFTAFCFGVEQPV